MGYRTARERAQAAALHVRARASRFGTRIVILISTQDLVDDRTDVVVRESPPQEHPHQSPPRDDGIELSQRWRLFRRERSGDRHAVVRLVDLIDRPPRGLTL